MNAPPASHTPRQPSRRSRQTLRGGLVFTLHLILILFAAWHVLIVVSQYLTNHFYTHDVGAIDYALYNTYHGRFMYHVSEHESLFAHHFAPFLLLLVPLHALVRHVLLVPLFECFAVFSGAWAMAWLVDGLMRGGRRIAGAGFSPLALAVGFFYVANPFVGSIVLANHQESLAVALGLWTLAAAANRRPRTFWVLLLGTLSVKEDLAIYWGLFGLYWIFLGWERPDRDGVRPLFGLSAKTRKLRRGGAIVALCIVWFVVAVAVVRMTAQLWGAPASAFAHRYAWLGEVLRAAPENPMRALELLWRPPWRMALLLLPTVGFLPLAAPTTLLPILPACYVMGLSATEPMSLLLYYYSYPFIPFLFLGVAFSVSKAMRGIRRIQLGRILSPILTLLFLGAGAYLATVPTLTDGMFRVPLRPTGRHAWVREQLRRHVPPEASVAAQFDLLCQVPYRYHMYALSETSIEQTEYWLFDLRGNYGDLSAEVIREMLERALAMTRRGEVRLVVSMDGLVIVHVPRKDAPADAGP